jgi:hypothetical protein
MSTGTPASNRAWNFARGCEAAPLFNPNPNPPKIERINNMPNNYGNGGGYPSTTGNSSGGGRSNGPRK